MCLLVSHAPVRRNHEFAAFELKMAQELEGADSLVGLLDPRVEPVVHVRDGFAVTYWKYYEPLPASEITPDEYAQALEGLHAEMRQLGVPHRTSPNEWMTHTRSSGTVRGVRSSLDDERELLTNALRSVRGAVVDRCTPEQLLHGEPHAGNVLKTANGMRFIDLETCCYGPVEFDIAHTPIEVGRRYRSADRLQLRDCRILMLAMIAAWRSDRDDDYSNGRKQRGLLINEIRKAVDHYGIDLYS